MDNLRYKLNTKKVTAIAAIFAILFAFFPLTNAKASTGAMSDGGPAVIIDDLDNCLTEDEELEVIYALDEACLAAGCSIGIVITSDLGGKTSKQFADDYSDELFGAGSDAVVLLLFNSYNKPEYANATDYISTSGKMTKKLDGHIDAMFTAIYDGMGEPKGDKYAYNEATGTYGGYDFKTGCVRFTESITMYVAGLVPDEDIDPGFGGIITSPDGPKSSNAGAFAEFLLALIRGIFRMLGGLRFGY